MAAHSSLAPRFGQADLSNCEREQIHLAGSIQPHGALLVVSEHDHVVLQASANAAAFLGLGQDRGGGLLGRPLEALEGDLGQRVRSSLDRPLDRIPTALRCRMGRQRTSFDGQVHRPPEGGLIVELEPAGAPVDLSRHVEAALQTIVGTPSLRVLADRTATLFKDLTGYDRVMVYRFDEEGHGEVLAEEREPALEPYLGNRYPASDIPQIARRLYERTRVRVLVDVAYTPVPIEPRCSPLTGRDLDMSLCSLRSMSPLHIQYLKNMGVGATLVASLLVGGRLWGLVACHHYAPRLVPYETRAACELLAETVATRIAALESFVQAQAELSVRRLEQRMIEAISREGDWRNALFDSSRSLLQPVNAGGVALLFEGQVLTAGEVPGTPQLRELGAWLDARPRAPVIATASLRAEEPDFAPLTAVASGLLATPVSSAPGEYLIWFRPEQVRTLVWGGNPFKPVLVGDNPADLSPRRSFAQWHQLVEGTSEPWTTADLTTARLIGDSVADVVLQFRSVRMLIAQSQLEQVRRQVEVSDQPVLIADHEGAVLLANEAMDRLLGVAAERPRHLDDLAARFAEPAPVRRSLRDLVRHRRTWRGEVRLTAAAHHQPPTPLLVRADPVLSAPGKVLGFVLLFTDLTERRAAETARRRFQEGLLEPHRALHLRLDSKADLVYRNLLTSVVGNAQLAALEITDGVDVGRMPEMLESVQASVTRTAELLEQLIGHATRDGSKTG